MKKTIRILIALFAACSMVFAFTACDEKKQEEDTPKEDTLMKTIYENITSSEAYQSWKEMYPEGAIAEKLDNNTITFTVKTEPPADGEEGDVTNDAGIVSGEYVFTHDGDYILCASGSEEKYVNPFVVQVRNAVCDYFEMSFVDVNEYIAANPDNTYYVEDLENKVTKIYVAEKWNLG